MDEFINLTAENIDKEHLCCAIADKKHQAGVDTKKNWLKERISEGHVFRKLNVKGKVFIEYAPLEKAWVPVNGDNFIYIYCLWVSGQYKGKGYAKQLLDYCISEAKNTGKSGVCVLAGKKKKPFLSEGKFFAANGFEKADAVEDYELLCLSFDGSKPKFADSVRTGILPEKGLQVFYGMQCPYIPDCIGQIKKYCSENSYPLKLTAVDSLEKAKNLPCIFNNWAVFIDGKFIGVHLLNEAFLKKSIEKYADK